MGLIKIKGALRMKMMSPDRDEIFRSGPRIKLPSSGDFI
jgi:hypothetical protein